MSSGAGLARKLRNAITGEGEACQAFQALDDGLPESERERWLRQEKKAMEDRGNDPSSMDIFEIQMDKGGLGASKSIHEVHPS